MFINYDFPQKVCRRPLKILHSSLWEYVTDIDGANPETFRRYRNSGITNTTVAPGRLTRDIYGRVSFIPYQSKKVYYLVETLEKESCKAFWEKVRAFSFEDAVDTEKNVDS